MIKDVRTHAIIGAAMEVHRRLGCGYAEAIYQEAFAMELESRKVPYRAEVEFPVVYKGRTLRKTHRADFLCYDSVVVETKALPQLTSLEDAQVISYLKASGNEVGLLLNFGARSLEFKRLVLSKSVGADPGISAPDA
jgi:GxxExxY protein